MAVGTPLERFAAKFCVEPRRECPKIFYGDPFGAIFVPNWVGQGSGASSFTFSLDLGLGLGLGPGLGLAFRLAFQFGFPVSDFPASVIQASLVAFR